MSADFDKWIESYHAGMLNDPDDSARFARASALDAWRAATFAAVDNLTPKWQPIETAPKGQRILVVNEKKSAPFCVKYILPGTLEANSDNGSDWADYDDAEGVYWCPEGWYLHSDCDNCLIEYRQYTGAQLTHWMPLSEVPE